MTSNTKGKQMVQSPKKGRCRRVEYQMSRNSQWTPCSHHANWSAWKSKKAPPAFLLVSGSKSSMIAEKCTCKKPCKVHTNSTQLDTTAYKTEIMFQERPGHAGLDNLVFDAFRPWTLLLPVSLIDGQWKSGYWNRCFCDFQPKFVRFQSSTYFKGWVLQVQVSMLDFPYKLPWFVHFQKKMTFLRQIFTYRNSICSNGRLSLREQYRSCRHHHRQDL